MIQKTYTITVDGKKSIKQLLKVGKFDYINPDLNDDNFHNETEGKVTKEITFVNFGRYMTSQEIIAEAKALGKRPARIEELLSWAAQHPEALKELQWAVALGSKAEVEGFVRVPRVWWYGDGREALLGYFDGGWDDGGFVGLLGEGSSESRHVDSRILGILDSLEQNINELRKELLTSQNI